MAGASPLPPRFERARLAAQDVSRERWDVYDAWRGKPMTVVVFAEGDALAVERAQRCFRFLATSDSPHLPLTSDWGVLPDGRPWLSAEPVADPPPVSSPATEAELEAYAIAGARALLEGHRAGLVHRLVSLAAFRVSADGQLVLGHWFFNGLTDQPDGLVTGVLPFIAPESLAGRPLPASDFYALGAMLYTMATGEPPFAAHDSAELALAQRRGPAPSVAARRPELPVRLTAAIDRMLAADPADRFSDGLSLLQALDAPLLPSVSAPPIDHERPLERLVRAYESFRQHSGGAIVLTGPPGSGKSTLLRQFMAEVALRGGEVASARPEAGQDRMGALEAWLDRRGEPPAEPIPAELPVAARTLFRRAAFINRLAAVSGKGRIVLVFEDLGALEEETIARLERLLADYGSHVMVVASVRGEEAAAGKVLGRLKRNPLVRELVAHPLDEAASTRLAETCLGAGVAALPIVKEAIAAAAGNPFMLLETLRAVVSGGMLTLGPGGWRMAASQPHLPLAPSLDAALSERMARLSPKAREIAAVVALMRGVTASRPLVAEALDETLTPELSLEFQALVAQRWLTREDTGFRLAHALLRPVLVRALAPEAQRRVHARLAVLLAGGEAPWEAIAYHQAASGDAAAASDTYERAAAAAAERGDALAEFRALQEAYRLTDDAERRRRLAKRLILPGSTIDPAFCAVLLEAALEADRPMEPVERLLAMGRLIACHLVLCRYDEALDGVVAALAEVPASAPWLTGLMLSYRALIMLQLGRFSEAREASAEALSSLTAADGAALAPGLDLHRRLATFSARVAEVSLPAYRGDPTRAEAAEALEQLVSEAGMPHLAAWPWITTAYSFTEEGRLAEARQALARGQGMLERGGAVPTAWSLALVVESRLHGRAGELDQALRSATAAVAYARANVPFSYNVGQALVAQAEALLATGQPSEAEAAASEALHLNDEGSVFVAHHARLVLAEALLRRRPADASRALEALLVDVSAPQTFNRLYQAQAWRLLGECRLALGAPGEALTRLQRAAEEADRHGWPYMQTLAQVSLGRYHKARRQFGRMQRVVMKAVQLAGAHGYDELRRQARALGQFGINSFAPLAELRRLLAHQGALDELIAHGLELARGLARSDRAAVFLADGTSLALAGSFPSGVDPLVTGHELLDEVLRERHTVWRQGVVSNRKGDWLVDAEVRSLVAVPLMGASAPIGVLYLDRRTAHEPFSHGEVAKLESLGSYLALAIDQALRARQASGAPPASDGRAARLEAAFAQMVEADRVRRGFLGAVSADLRHQLGALRESLHGLAEHPEAQEALVAALEHAERLAEILEKGIRD